MDTRRTGERWPRKADEMGEDCCGCGKHAWSWRSSTLFFTNASIRQRLCQRAAINHSHCAAAATTCAAAAAAATAGVSAAAAAAATNATSAAANATAAAGA
jgi:hypothetical protein